MALKLIKKISGVNCEYWRITEVLSSELNSTTKISISCYLNREVRKEDQNNTIGKFIVITVPGTKYNYSDLYTKLKNPFLKIHDAPMINFAEAEDIFEEGQIKLTE